MNKKRIEEVIKSALDKGRKPMAETKSDKLAHFFMEENRFCFTFENKRGETYTDDYSLIDLISHCGGLLKFLNWKNPNESSMCENTVTISCFRDGKPERDVYAYTDAEYHQMKLIILNREEVYAYLYTNIAKG